MFYRINKNSEIIEKVSGYYKGFHADIEPKIQDASDEQKKLYAIPESELVELAGSVTGELFTSFGTARFVANAGQVEENPAAVKEEAMLEVALACDNAIKPLLAKYPMSEIVAFPTKRALAYRWVNMTEDEKKAALSDREFAIIVNEAAAVAEVSDVDALVVKILKNAERFEVHSGLCLRVKKSLINRILESVGTRKAVDAIKADMIFPAAE
jgi:sRNA-binding protein